MLSYARLPPARLARLKAHYLAVAPDRRTAMLSIRIAPRLVAEIEAQRALYAERPSKAEVVTQLLEEAIALRRANRPRSSGAWKPARGAPFKIDI
jgi:hypothetical protein